MRRELIAIIVTAALLIGAAVSQSSWYPRSQDYTTSGGFVGSFFNVTGDGYVGGNLTVDGTDLVGAVNETAGRVYDLETNATEQQAAIDALESPPVWHVQTITTPAAATSDEVLNGTDGAITTDGTNIDAANMTGTIDAARCLILTPGVSMTGDALLTGTNVNNEAITETIAWGANATATTTTQAFKALTWANFTTDTNTSVTIDYSDKLGLSVIPDDADAVMFTFLGGVMETTLPTVTIGATVAECLADLDSALTGVDVKIYVYEA